MAGGDHQVRQHVGSGVVYFDAGRVDLLWLSLVAGCGLLAVGLLVLERRIPPGVNGGSGGSV